MNVDVETAPSPEAEGFSPPDTQRVRRILLKGLLVALAAGSLTGAASLLLERSRPAPTPVDYGALPAFSLTDQAGHPFGSAELAGHPWIAGFIFTSCTDSCPLITAHMASLQKRLAGTGVRFVSFSVDPARDTPAKLADYGRKAGANFARWSFLTGPIERIQPLVTHGFKLSMLGGDPKAGEGDIVHDEHLVLVDGHGQLRGYYDSEPEAIARLGREARALTEEP